MFSIGNRIISGSEAPYIIAELSANHNGSFERAKLSIKAAKECGAHAVKMQTYTADTMTIDCNYDDFIVHGGLWNGYKLYDLYHEAHTPYEWHEELFKYANQIGITIFSTPFDESAVELLESLNAPAYKIASFELTDIPLIECVARTGKPIFMSTGISSESEISEAVEAARKHGCNSLLLFHCISSYPAPINQCNLRQLITLKHKFGVEVGLSDHTIGNTAAIAAVALGACAVEKHFTISRNDRGPDSEFSAEPEELRNLVNSTKDAWSALGVESFTRPNTEFASKTFRRSIYFMSDVKAGDKIRPSNIRRIRPGFGLPPKYFDKLIGMTLAKDVLRGQPVTWDDLKDCGNIMKDFPSS